MMAIKRLPREKSIEILDMLFDEIANMPLDELSKYPIDPFLEDVVETFDEMEKMLKECLWQEFELKGRSINRHDNNSNEKIVFTDKPKKIISGENYMFEKGSGVWLKAA